MTDITSAETNNPITRLARAAGSAVLMTAVSLGAALAQQPQTTQQSAQAAPSVPPAVAAGIKDGAANWKLPEVQAAPITPSKSMKDAATALQSDDSRTPLGADGKPVAGPDGQPTVAGLKPAIGVLQKAIEATDARVRAGKTPHMEGEARYLKRTVGDKLLEYANEFCATKPPVAAKDAASAAHPICATFTPEATDPSYQKGVWTETAVQTRYKNGGDELNVAMTAVAKLEADYTNPGSRAKDIFGKGKGLLNSKKAVQVDDGTQAIVNAYAKLDQQVETLAATYQAYVVTLTEPAPPPPPVAAAALAPSAPATPAEAKAQALWKVAPAHDVPADQKLTPADAAKAQTTFEARNHQLQLLVAKGAPTIANAATKATADAVAALEATDLIRIVAAADKKAGTHLADEATPKAPGASGFQQLKLAARAVDDGAASFDAETQANLAASLTHGLSVLHAAAPTAFPAATGASPAHAAPKKTSEVVIPREIFGARQGAGSLDFTA